MQQKFTNSSSGFLYGSLAYVLWGFLPFYFKALTHIPPQELLSHRALWSMILLIPLALLGKRWRVLGAIISKPKQLFLLVASALFIGSNWFIYIWSVENDHLLAASLGYYITPLVVILLSAIFLKERFSKQQSIAIGLATIGVFIQVFFTDSLPFVSLGLAFSFGFYGLIRKYISVDPISGLLIETVVLSFFAFYFLFVLESHSGDLIANGWYWNLMLMLAGLVTTLPLLLYAEATNRINLSAMGFLQYITPTIVWTLAVFVFHEPFSHTTFLSFAFIWLGLLFFSSDFFRKQ